MYLLDCINLFLLIYFSLSFMVKGDFISHNALVIMQSIWPLLKSENKVEDISVALHVN